ncbi:Sir2 family NAD+-dependent deacetylase [Bdellovibrionota bacterium FG-1]
MTKPTHFEKSTLVVLTGAGISAESGIKTFRDHGGLWENHNIEDVASIQGYRKDPGLVQRFYNARRAQLLEPQIEPNAAHQALARLEREWKGRFLLVTQNVDDLHERAGTKNLIHMHGELLKVRCEQTEEVYEWRQLIEVTTKCVCCNQVGTLRPHIVWFGEVPFSMDEIMDVLLDAAILVSMGTSGNVYPAAGFVRSVPEASWKIEVNREESEISSHFNDQRVGLASELVPQLVDELLGKF